MNRSISQTTAARKKIYPHSHISASIYGIKVKFTSQKMNIYDAINLVTCQMYFSGQILKNDGVIK